MTAEIINIPASEYHADSMGDVPYFSASIATKLCNETPLHAWTAHPKLNPHWQPRDTKDTDIGRVVHALLLEGRNIAEILDYPDYRKKEAQEARDNARAAGKIPILKDAWAEIELMESAARRQLKAHAEASNAFTGGKSEVTIVFDLDGVKCKTRLDWLHDSGLFIDDFKSAASADPDHFAKSMVTYGYDIQAALYRRAAKAVTGKDATFRFIVQEKEAPYALSVIGVNPEMLMFGERRLMQALDRWRECLKKNEWPGYPDRICYPLIPAWIENAMMEKELREVC